MLWEFEIVLVLRFLLVPAIAFLVANCASQIDAANYAFSPRDTDIRASLNKRHPAPAKTANGGKLPSKKAVPRTEVVKAGVGTIGTGTGSDTVAQPPNAATPVNPKLYLDKSVAEDKEYNILKAKTVICRGC